MSRDESDHEVLTDLWVARLVSGRRGRLIVRSGSMAPLLKLGDEIVVSPHARRVFPGDLVVFRDGDKLVCHRIMLPLAPGRYLQKGDINPEWETVSATDIVGIPTRASSGGREFSLQGGAFRCWNTLLWLLVAGRDLARLCCRPVPRLTWRGEGLFSRPILAIIRRIRQQGGEIHGRPRP